MEFFSHNTHIDFMRQRKLATIVSVILIVASIAVILVKGLNLGLDFTGGTQIEISLDQAADLDGIRDTLNNADFPEAVVQSYGTSRDVLIRIGPQHDNQDELRETLLTLIPGATLQSVEYIGPQVGETLITNGILAIIVSLLGTMLYIAMRFEFRFAVSAAVALLHDPIITLGVFALFAIEFNLISLAAVLTIIGYSLNDTIVVYDRVRENFRKMRKGDSTEIMNVSINQTLSRTIMTSGLTMFVVIALLLFGGETLFGFSVALAVGIIVGTYSSIYVAGSLAIAMGLKRTHLIPPVKQEADEMP